MTKIKTITIITSYYYPEDTAIGLYTTQFSKSLSHKGYLVKVLTGFPNYPQWKIYDNYIKKPSFFSEFHEGIEIIRYKQYIPKKIDFKGRVLMMLSLFYGTLINLRKVKETDLVICIVPPTISILTGVFLSKIKKAKLWIHVQDFEFDLAMDSGIVKKDGLFSKLFRSSLTMFEKKMLNSADIVSSISFSMLRKIREKSNHIEPYFFPNWVSSKRVNPETSSKHPNLQKSDFNLLYSGNIGEKQDWEFLEKLCQMITVKDGINIVIVGDGVYKKTLSMILAPFTFVSFYEPVAYVELNDLLCSADIHFLFQKNDVVDTIMPSKILGMMASSKPSIITGNVDSEVFTIISKSKGGIYLHNNDVKNMYDEIINLKNNSSLRIEMGINARNFILNEFSEEKILDLFNDKINQLLT